MAVLPTRSFDAIVSNIAAGMQGRYAGFLNFAVGKVFRALAEAYAGASLWLQSEALKVAKLTRLSTSYGSDADDWLADYGIVKRIGAVAATGLVVFGRFTASSAAPLIKVGAQVKTQDGSQTFQVYADTSNPSFDVGQSGYVMPPQVVSLVVPVISITPSATAGKDANGNAVPGANGNVTAGAISLISSQIAGVDQVTNPAAFTNGSDQEQDGPLKARFRQGVQALSRATPDAIAFAIQSLQTNLQVKVASNTAPDGSVLNGMTTVYVDDGTGSISSTLLATCQAAAFKYLAAGTRMGVYAASQSLVSVQLSITVLPGYSRANVAALFSAAIATGINGSGLGNGVNYYTIGSWALAVPGVAKIDNLLVNGGTADLTPNIGLTYKCRGVVVS